MKSGRNMEIFSSNNRRKNEYVLDFVRKKRKILSVVMEKEKK